MLNDPRTPLYMQIQAYFKERIVAGKLPEHERIATEKQLMEQFKVSRITVANALAALSKEGWIYRIPGRGSFVAAYSGRDSQPSAVEEIKYVPEPVERKAAEPINSNLIGLILPTIDDFFAIRLLRGIGQVINESRYNFVIFLTHNEKEREKEAIRKLQHMGVAGMLIFPVNEEIYNEEILAMKINGYPFVLIDRYFPGVETHSVSSDGSWGAQLAVSHLYELGHTDIAICSDVPLPTVTVEERLSGYMKELKRRGAMINPALILTDFSVDYPNIREDHPLFRYIKNRMASAYITSNGKLGQLVYRIAQKLGLRVPEDLSIVTFDDPSAEYDWSVFTHISQSEDVMGSKAAKLLIDLLERPEENRSYHKVILVPELVVEQTTGPVSVKFGKYPSIE